MDIDRYIREYNAMSNELAAAKAELAACREDAENFRWLQENPEHKHVPVFDEGKWGFPYLVSNAFGFGGGVGFCHFESLSEAIKAARKEGA